MMNFNLDKLSFEKKPLRAHGHQQFFGHDSVESAHLALVLLSVSNTIRLPTAEAEQCWLSTVFELRPTSFATVPGGKPTRMTTFFRRLSPLKIRKGSVPAKVDTDTARLSEAKLLSEETTASPTSITQSPPDPTARNVLKFALLTLSSVTNNLPLTSDNARGLNELAARIELLTPIVSEMAETNPSQGRTIVEALQRELQSITRDLEVASSQGRLSRFFNSADIASSLEKHNMNRKFVTVHEVLKSLREREPSRPPEYFPPEVQIVEIAGQLVRIAGGCGGPGAESLIVGEGGDGEGPQLNIDPAERWNISHISGEKTSRLFVASLTFSRGNGRARWGWGPYRWQRWYRQRPSNQRGAP
ncbi:hypothetical protein C8R47DRAFT_1073534 [Mycena vitilis]|nr:hypothetical protein C8R47DRAFT_1073534 [Mycena vitilis]